MPSGGVAVKAGPIGWGAVAAGVFGLLALFLPWFTPKVSGNGKSATTGTSFHPWNGFFFLVIAPVVLILAAVMWFQAMQGKHNSRYAGSANPVRSLSLQSIVFGVVSLVLGLLSFVILTASYKFKTESGNISWSKASSELKALGDTLERGPQIGLYLLFLGAIVLIVVGVLGLATKPIAAPVSPLDGGGFGGFTGPPQGFAGLPQGFTGPPQGFAGPPQGFTGPAQGYGNPSPGYGGPAQSGPLGGPQAGGFPPPPAGN
jgi:hypothetical protein